MTDNEKDTAMGKGGKISITFTVINTLLIVALLISLKSGLGKQERPPASSIIRDAASSLEARGLYWSALNELERYRDSGKLSSEDEADLLYKMGKLADQKIGDCPRALTYYTMAVFLNPDAEWTNEANKASVVCLEKQGKKQQAQALLNQLTGGDDLREQPPEKPIGETVVALIDGRSITWEEVKEHQVLNRDDQNLEDPDVRNQLVQHYVYVLLMVDEAIKKGYASDPEIEKMLVQARRQALAQEFMRREGIDLTNEEVMRKLRDDLTKIHEVRIFKTISTDAQEK